jgi:hypothetical protein
LEKFPAFVALGLVLALGCGRSSSGHGSGGTGAAGGTGGASVDGGTGGSRPGGGSGGGSGGTRTGGTGGTIGEAGGGGMPEECVPASPPRSKLRKLNRFQIETVLSDVFGAVGPRTERLVEHDTSSTLSDDGDPVLLWVAAFHEIAHEVASEATQTNAALTQVLGCDPEADGESECRKSLDNVLLPRLLRRPLLPEDQDEYDSAFAAGLELGGTFASGARMVIEVALQSPDFLYLIEVGEPLDVQRPDPRAGWGRPTPLEMASRLSFLLWGSAPDAELLAEAAAGGLRTKEEVRATAERLMGDERAVAAMRYLHLRMLRLLDGIFAPDAPLDLTERLFFAMRSETGAFLDDVASSGPGGFESLLTAPYTYLNEELAALYGVPGVTGTDLRKVSLASPQASGVLTQGSLLSAHSVGEWTSPAGRGAALWDAFLCGDSLIPPPNHDSQPVPQTGLTTRESVEQATQADASCLGCHSLVNPLGFALEHYDAVGRYRDTEAGKPIDAGAEVTLGEETHEVDGASELGRALADSSTAKTCYVQNWVAYAYAATPESPLDECSREQLLDAFERSNGDIRALVLELTQTDAFLYRGLEMP